MADTRRAQVRAVRRKILAAQSSLTHADLALQEIIDREDGQMSDSPIDARDAAMLYVRDAAALVAPLEDAIGNLPGIDPWEDA